MAVMRLGSLVAAVVVALAFAGDVAQAAKPKPLPLRPRELGSSPNIATSFDGRFMVAAEREGRAAVIDDGAGRRYSQSAPVGCLVSDVRMPEALLNCPEASPNDGPTSRRPLILDLRDGRQTALRGYQPSIDLGYQRLGAQWLQGTFDTFQPHVPTGTVHLNRFTGERRERQAALGLDLDSPDLSRDARPHACSGPGREFLDPSTRRWLTHSGRRGRDRLVLHRCGRKRQLISRCPDQCYGPGEVTKRFVVWPGNHSVVIHSIRTRRRFKLRFPRHDSRTTGYGIIVASTDRRVRISLARPGPSGSRTLFRTIEVRLPLALR